MKSLQDYINDFRQIAEKLQLTGDSVELLVQMLANATYISEVEQSSYANESSIERATLMNSKIQHCVNLMYSVFRGKCPRVILRFKCNKVLSWKRHDVVYSSNRFKLYSDDDPVTFFPDAKMGVVHEIQCILAAERVEGEYVLPDYNRYYFDIYDTNLSNDLYAQVNGEDVEVFRRFSDHVRYGGIFDLTMPDFGCRFYSPDIFRKVPETDSYNEGEELPPSNTVISYGIYKYCLLSDFNESELKRINIPGTEFMPIKSGETFPGITLLNEIPRDEVNDIHYKANRERYANSILRSNTDIGVLLEEMFPDKVVKGGTFYDFVKVAVLEDELVENPDGSTTTKKSYKLRLRIYYIPQNQTTVLLESDITKFKEENTAYYVTENIEVTEGEKCDIYFYINLELYQNLVMDSQVREILSDYEDKFNMDLESKLPEIESAISKLPNVRSFIRTRDTSGNITDLGIRFVRIDQNGNEVEYKPSKTSYCKIDCKVTGTVLHS